MTPSHEDQGTGFDPGARGYELQGRKAAPDPSPDADLPATDAREDFATDPIDQKAAPAPEAAPPAAKPAQDGPKAPEPVQAAPTPPPDVPFVAYPELHEEHPARLPPAARPVRQGG